MSRVLGLREPGKVFAAIKTGFPFGAERCIMHQPYPPLPIMPNAPAKPIRLTISVTPEVHAAFERLAAASGMSMSRCMGDWLGDTLDAVEYTAQLVERARAAPKLVMREVHAYALGLADETGSVLKTMRSNPSLKTIREAVEGKSAGGDGSRSPAQRGAGGRAAGAPPSCNTGGKVPGKRQATGGKA